MSSVKEWKGGIEGGGGLAVVNRSTACYGERERECVCVMRKGSA